MIIVKQPLAGGTGARPRSGFSFVLTRVNTLFLLLLPLFAQAAATNSFPTAPNPYLAQNYTGHASNGGTATVAFTYNGTSTVTVNWVHSGTTVSGTAAGVEWGTATGAGTGASATGSNNSGAGGSGTATISRTLNQWVYGQVLVDNTTGSGTYSYGRFYYQVVGATNAYVDFKVPANSGTETVNIKFWQNGVVVSSLSVSPGAGASTVHLTGLTSGQMVTAVYGYPENVAMPGGTILSTPDRVFEVGGGANATTAAEPPDPTQLLPFRATAGPVPNQPTAVTPATPQTSTAAPTAIATPSAPAVITKYTRTVIGVPFGTPSGTSGVTKADSETIANAIVAATNTADANQSGRDDKLIDATNNVATTIATQTNSNLSAINALRTESVAGVNKQLAAANNAQLSLEGVVTELRKANSYLDVTTRTLGELEILGKAPAPADSNAKMTDVVNVAQDLMDSVAEATDVQPDKGTVMTDDEDAGDGIPDVTIPGSTAGGHTAVTMSLNPLQNAQVRLLASLIRALIGWAVIFSLVAWTYMQIPIWMTDALKGGSGFTAWRAAVGAIPLIGIAVMTFLVLAGGAIMLTAPTIMWAYADPLLMGQASSALVDVREIVTVYGGPNAGHMISIMDAFCPTGLCMTAVFNYITLKIGGQAICAALIAFSKVLAS